jgi:hypothetical protein
MQYYTSVQAAPIPRHSTSANISSPAILPTSRDFEVLCWVQRIGYSHASIKSSSAFLIIECFIPLYSDPLIAPLIATRRWKKTCSFLAQLNIRVSRGVIMQDTQCSNRSFKNWRYLRSHTRTSTSKNLAGTPELRMHSGLRGKQIIIGWSQPLSAAGNPFGQGSSVRIAPANIPPYNSRRDNYLAVRL